ncbi:MAG: hypothetical protein KJO28_08385, partial [Desulfofustis sp.]|nr:hypothetical protein [Desulfofustis sp.]
GSKENSFDMNEAISAWMKFTADVWGPMVRNMNQKALDYIIGQVPIGRLIEPEEVAMLVGDIYRNEALAGEVFFIHGGLRLGSKG